jgi:hypothetical protein
MTTMAAVADLIRDTRKIMLYASPVDIECERQELSKWFDQRWAEIPRQHDLAKALISADELPNRFGRRIGAVLARRARNDLLAKAELGDQIAASQIEVRLRPTPVSGR